MGLLDEDAHVDWIARTHPELALSRERLPMPSFVAPVAVMEALEPKSWTRRLAENILQLRRSLAAPPALFLGTPFERYDQSAYLGGVDPQEIRHLALSAARALGLELCVLPNVAPDDPLLDAWLDAGFVALASFPDTRIDLAPSDFEAHLATLPQGDRSGIRRNERRFGSAGHHITRISDAAPHAETLYHAYRTFFDRAKVHWVPYSLDYFKEITTQGEAVRLFGAFSREEELIGFVLNFEDGAMVHTGRIGVAPAYHHRDRVYFALLYAAVRDALSLPRARALSLEPTSYRTKRHLGAVKLPMVNLVLGTGPTWRALLATLTPLGRWMLRHLEDERRLDRAFRLELGRMSRAWAMASAD
ncbi:MAG: GNAT family N-acetyltransferase [Myxococcota bacterium]